MSFNNATKTFSFVYSTASGLSREYCLKIEKLSPLASNEVVNITCQNGTSGTILATIPGDVGSSTYIAKGYMVGSTHILSILEASFDEGYKQWGKDGILATVFLRIAVACIGIWSPLIAIILLAFIDIFMVILGLYSMSLVTIVLYLVLISATVWRLGKR